jgi:DNA-binding protein HU-beta
MTKAELITAISAKTGLPKTQTELVFSATFETIAELLAQSEKVMIPGFGGFSGNLREARTGRNPATGKEIAIPAKVVANFKAATQLKEKLNRK